MCETKAQYFSCNINTTSRQHTDLVTTYSTPQIKPFTVANILALVVYYVTANRLKYIGKNNKYIIYYISSYKSLHHKISYRMFVYVIYFDNNS